MRPKGSSHELEHRRLRAVELMRQGEPQKLVARIFGVGRCTLYRWRKSAEAGALEAKPHLGPPRRLRNSDYQHLVELLSQGAVTHGWVNNLWTTARVAQLIEKHFGVKYHPDHVSRILKNDLNWTCQKPVHHYKDRDDKAIAKWVRNTFPCILANAERRGAYLVFVDEAGFMLEPTVRRTWAPRGETPVDRISNPHARLSTIGAIAICPRRERVALAYALLADNLNFKAPTVVQFVQTLHSELAGAMTVLWDQIPIHEGVTIEEYLADEPEVVIEPFPPYAPELNPADGIWRYVKFGRLPNYTPSDLGTLRSTLTTELERLKKNSDLLRSFIRFTKLPVRL